MASVERAGEIVSKEVVEAAYKDHACVVFFAPVVGQQVVCGVCGWFTGTEKGWRRGK